MERRPGSGKMRIHHRYRCHSRPLVQLQWRRLKSCAYQSFEADKRMYRIHTLRTDTMERHPSLQVKMSDPDWSAAETEKSAVSAEYINRQSLRAFYTDIPLSGLHART